jgi:hypothetical protein
MDSILDVKWTKISKFIEEKGGVAHSSCKYGLCRIQKSIAKEKQKKLIFIEQLT